KIFYPWIEITFELSNFSEHYHIPLLIIPYGFTTYRDSLAECRPCQKLHLLLRVS
ncbi:hypothetical protein F5051DRAFT_336609, partial [Lentinula edodes]